jgi:tRNA(Ile)-lysidine synthase
MRSHPPALLKLVARTLREECELGTGQTLLAAVSGGPDSMALLHVLTKLRAKFGFSLAACGVDHGLRAEAQHELALAAEFAASQAVPFVCKLVQVSPGGNLQARARTARYQALEEARSELGATLVATGHHADDRAETVLLRLLRGSGPEGLAVLPARSGLKLRPLIRARRSQIFTHLARHAVPFALDPSNENPRFARTRVRRELLPLMESLSAGIVEHLTALADEIVGPPLPLLTDATGEPLRLNRSQRAQLRRALCHRQPATRVLLPAGLVIVMDASGQPVLVTADAALDPAGLVVTTES